MDKCYQVSGYGVNQRGLTVGCNYTIHAKDIISAKADAINEAKAGGLNHVTITRIQEVAA